MSTPTNTERPTNAELACSYAALILADDSVDITADKLLAIIKAAGIDDVEPIWTTLFAKALEGKAVKEILTAAPTAGPGPVVEAPKSNGILDGDNNGEDGDGEKDGDDGEESDEDLGNLFDL